MVVRGLERCGRRELARQIALEHLQRVGEVFKNTGTVWENYASDAVKPGTPAKADFVGWTGIVPILYFLEYAIGLKPDALNNRLTWLLGTEKRCGCERYRFNGHTVTLLAEPSAAEPGVMRLMVDSDGDFQLCVRRGPRTFDYAVKRGKNVWTLRASPSLSRCDGTSGTIPGGQASRLP